MSDQPRNPYAVLRLTTTASLPDVIRRSRELCDQTMDRALQAEYRRAAEEIRQHPVSRACCQFWEPPETAYDESLSTPSPAGRGPG